MSYLRGFLLVVVLLTLAPFPALASGVKTTLAGRPTVYWAPENPAGNKQPLILFSHGFKGCAAQSSFLTEALAKAGYWVFAPDHDDAVCGGHIGNLFDLTARSFTDPESWDDTVYADRADNLRDLVDTLKDDPQFKDRIDFSRIGLMGHSLGGYTVMGLAGGWTSWKMRGVKAVLALSPHSHPFIVHHTVAGISIPIMYQGGTRDFETVSGIKKIVDAYHQTTSPKYLVEFNGANHFAWTNLSHQYRESIIAYSVAFFDHYLKGIMTSDLTTKRSDVSRFWYNSDLGKAE